MDLSHTLYTQAREAMDAGDLPRAIDRFQGSAMVHAHPKTYELLGECHLRQGDLPNAILYLSAASGLGNRQFRSRYLLAQALEARGEPLRAVQKLDEALAAQPCYRSARELRERYMALHPEIHCFWEEPVAAPDGEQP